MSRRFDFSETSGGRVVPLKKEIKDKLNAEQIEVSNSIKDFLKSDEKYYSLIGKGGTGKTTIISHALEGAHNILGIAISHKAVERLSDSIQVCHTLAKALGMSTHYNEHGEMRFVMNKYLEQPIKKAYIIVVDECSMITDKNMTDINNLTGKVKIIYMGDFRQLPPIEEGRVPDADSRSFNFKKNQSELTLRVRQGIGNPIIELSDVVSSEIENKTNNPYVIMNHLHKNINKDGKGYDYLDQDYISDFVYDYKENNSTRFVCFRNYKIKSQNKKIRDMVHNSPKKPFIKGDLMIANKSLFVGETMVMKNSQEFFIESVEKTTYKGVDCWSIISNDLKSVINVVSKEGKVAYKKQLDKLTAEAKKSRKWGAKKSFQDAFAVVDYGYAINTHKAQGSTYKNVYLDFNDILTVSKITNKEKCQSLYVGISRASDNLKLVDL